MAWQLVIVTKNAGMLTVDFESEDAAKEALQRAAEELRRADKGGSGPLAIFEGRHAVAAGEVVRISVEEERGPLVA